MFTVLSIDETRGVPQGSSLSLCTSSVFVDTGFSLLSVLKLFRFNADEFVPQIKDRNVNDLMTAVFSYLNYYKLQ